MQAVKLANMGLRFVLEMCALGLLAFWGYHAAGETGVGVALGAGVALLFAAVWGLLASPKAPVSLPQLMKVGVQMTLLLLPAAALLHMGEPSVAGGFAVLIVGNAVLLEADR